MGDEPGGGYVALSPHEVQRFAECMKKYPYVKEISIKEGATPPCIQITMSEGPAYWGFWGRWDIEFPDETPMFARWKRLADGYHIFFRSGWVFDFAFIHSSTIYIVLSFLVYAILLMNLNAAGSLFSCCTLPLALAVLFVGFAFMIARAWEWSRFFARVKSDAAEAAKAATGQKKR